MGKFTLVPEVSPEGFVSLGLFTFNTAAKFCFSWSVTRTAAK